LPGNQMISMMIGKQALPVYQSGKWYTVAPNEKGDALAVGPYEGPMHALVIDHTKVVKPADARQTISLYRHDQYRCTLQVTEPAKGVKLPAGVYRYVNVQIASKPAPLRFNMRNARVDKDQTIALDKPKLQASVSLRGRTINVDQKIIAPNGINYSMVRGKKGPLVEILSAKAPDKVLVTANMEYG
jgi:hypothetical protein